MATTTVGAGGSQPTVVVVTTMYSNAGNAVTPNESEFRSKFVALIALNEYGIQTTLSRCHIQRLSIQPEP